MFSFHSEDHCGFGDKLNRVWNFILPDSDINTRWKAPVFIFREL